MSIESTTSTKKEKRTLNIIPLYRDTSPAPGISTTRPKSASYSAPAEDKALKASEDGRKELDLKLGLSKMVKETEKKERRFLEEISEKLTNFSPNNKETEKPPEKSASGEKTPTCDLNHPGTDNKAPEGHSEPKKRRFALSHPLAQLRGVRSPNIRCKTLSDGRTVFMFLISGTSYLVKKQIGRGGWSNVYKVIATDI